MSPKWTIVGPCRVLLHRRSNTDWARLYKQYDCAFSALNCRKVVVYHVNKKISLFYWWSGKLIHLKIENVHFLAGLCLYLEKRGIGLGFYDCSNFSNGCPYSSYSSETIYTCKTKFWFEKIFIRKTSFS